MNYCGIQGNKESLQCIGKTFSIRLGAQLNKKKSVLGIKSLELLTAKTGSSIF